ncbi:hypothetical protein [Knoellia sp. Soil729]|uniref:hypothetical protein n=1 Tax=Knoellia sp. Soil729 TaxID=1736394 RepID=UPI0006F68DED|nr:hypothetical protein [Knoellia sp. Soil729]KRE44117.1 hypothetical protein ASG74_04670 [Knoellia sp. Soil729]
MAIDDAHTRPDGTSDATVEAVGKLSEAFEAIEEARGHLFSFHRTVGRADLLLGDAIEQLRAAGHDDLAREIETEVLGRNIIEGRWTFQIVEDFDDGYYATFRDHDQRVRDELLGGKRHVYEAEMKEERRTAGRRGHEATPDEAGSS